MTRLTLPSDGYTSKLIERRRNDTHNTLMNGNRQIIKRQQDDFILKLTIPPMTNIEAQAWQAFLLQGAEAGNDFLLSPPGHVDPPYGGNPKVRGSGQIGKNIICDGVSANALILKAGAWVSISERLNMVTEEVQSSNSGICTIKLMKPVISAPVDNSVVEIQSPQGAFEFAESAAGISFGKRLSAGFVIDAIEVR